MGQSTAPFALLLSLALAVAAAGTRGRCAAEEKARVIGYRVEAWEGDGAVAREVLEAAATTVQKRCDHAGFDGVTVNAAAAGDRIELRLRPGSSASESAIRRLAERRGLVQFRVRAEQAVEQEYRERRLEGGVAPPAGYEWVQEEQEETRTLLEVPERAAAAKLHEVGKKAAPDSPEFRAALAAYERTVQSAVFDNTQIARATVQRSMSTRGAQVLPRIAVRFEFRSDRQEAFEKFTGAHVGRGLAVVVDGKIHACPPIKSALPGMGELTGSGHGYTEEQASEMAALFACGPLPCRLVAEKAK